MSSVNKLREDLDVTKRELKNLRQEIHKQNAVMRSELGEVLSHFSLPSETAVFEKPKKIASDKKLTYSVTPIGYISSCFKFKNGIPRQPSLCPSAKGTLKIEKTVFTNPEHSLIGLEQFSHVWILFLFHENENVGVKAKVHPPRLNGASVGVFSTRSPHRPSPIGLSLVKLDKIEDDTLFLSGIDLLDGTPVIDIKPYIPMYDNPLHNEDLPLENNTAKLDLHYNQDALCETTDAEKEISNLKVTSSDAEVKKCIPNECKIPEFLRGHPVKLNVVFTIRALSDLDDLQMNSKSSENVSCYDSEKIKRAITEVLENDPRSVYRKEKCSDRLYYFYINQFHITSWFDDHMAEVLRIKLADQT